MPTSGPALSLVLAAIATLCRMHEPAAARAADRSRRRARRDRQAHPAEDRQPRSLGRRHLRGIRSALDPADDREHLRRHRSHGTGIDIPGQPASARPSRHRASRDRQPRRALSHPSNGSERRARPAVSDRRDVSRATRQGEDREGAERHLRGLHQHGAARRAHVRQPQSRAHRRADAGQHRVRRTARRREALSLSGLEHASATKCSHVAAGCTSASRICSTIRRTTTTWSTASPTSTQVTTPVATRRFRTR